MERFGTLAQTKTASIPPAARCATCGDPVPNDSVRALFFDGKWWHVPCAPLDRVPFPYAWAIEKARLAVERARAEGADTTTFAAILGRLEAAAAAWPGESPARLFADAAVAVRELVGLREPSA